MLRDAHAASAKYHITVRRETQEPPDLPGVAYVRPAR